LTVLVPEHLLGKEQHMNRKQLGRMREAGQTWRLELEQLEDRCCPSTFTVNGSNLVIQGDNAANVVELTDDGQGNLTGTVDGEAVEGAGITNVVFHGRKGDDSFTYTLTGQRTTGQHLVLNLGDGDDTVTLDYAAGVAGPRLKIDLTAGKGNDTTTATFGELSSAVNLFFRANLGDGDDTLDTTLAGGVLDTARARFKVQAHKGIDTVAFHATTGNVDAGALLDLDVHGGKGDDNVTVNTGGQMNGTFKLTVDASTDSDTVTANLAADAGSTGSFKATVRGGTGDDTLTLNLDDQSGGGGDSTLSLIKALLDGGAGFDTAFHTGNVELVRCEVEGNNNA